MNDAVVITGTGIVCSLGSTLSEVWDSLLSGRHGMRPIEGFDASGFGCSVAAQVHGINPLDLGINPRDSRIMDTHSYLLMKGARDAFVQSGLDAAGIPGEEIGFFAGMGMVDYEVEALLPAFLKSLGSDGNLSYDAFYSSGFKEIYPLWPLSMLNNISFCQVAIRLNIKGENTVFSPHADSGVQAVAEGVKTVIDKKAKVVFAGGVSEKVTPLSLARGHLCGILNTYDGKDTVLCRPFDAQRKGTIPGEGCGVVALELLSSARGRGASPLAAVTGYGAACESERECAGPTVKAFSTAMTMAIGSAGIKPSDIDVVIAHGDGTVIGDKNEIEAINRVFSDRIHEVSVFASKGALGHLLAAAPVVDIILAISMIRNSIVPMTLNSASPDEAIRFNFVNRGPLKAAVKRVLINCQSSEGQAASLLLESVEE